MGAPLFPPTKDMAKQPRSDRSALHERREQHAREKLSACQLGKPEYRAVTAPSRLHLVLPRNDAEEILRIVEIYCRDKKLDALSAIADAVYSYWTQLLFRRSDLGKFISTSKNFLEALHAMDSISMFNIGQISANCGDVSRFLRRRPTPAEEALMEQLGSTNWLNETNEILELHAAWRVERLNICAQLAQLASQAPSRGTKRDGDLENLVALIRNIWVHYLGQEDRLRDKKPFREFLEAVVHVADSHVTPQMIDTALRKIDRIPPQPRNGTPR